MFLPSFSSASKPICNSIAQYILYTTLYCAIYSVFLFDTVIWLINFELFLLFLFVLFVSSINFLGNVLLLGNMRRFGKLSPNSSSSSASEEEEAESGIEKGLRLIVHLCSSTLNDLNQKGILDSSKHKMLFNNNRINEITV